MLSVILLSVAFYLVFCWMALLLSGTLLPKKCKRIFKDIEKIKSTEFSFIIQFDLEC
jgi:hypothetical protein